MRIRQLGGDTPPHRAQEDGEDWASKRDPNIGELEDLVDLTSMPDDFTEAEEACSQR